MNEDVDLSETERRALESLAREHVPPPAVEARVVSDLRARGLVRSPRTGVSWLRPLALAAMVVAAFAAGIMWQRVAGARRVATGPRFVLLLYGGEGAKSPARHEEYAAWARAEDRRGAVIGGEELAGDVGALPAAPSATSGAPLPEPPAGFFIVSAATLEDARQIAATCPHLQHGGRIVIRSIAGDAAPR